MTDLTSMRSVASHIHWLALIPFFAFIVGVAAANRVHPMIFGMPLILGWIVMWIPITAIIMAVIYFCDPKNNINAEGTDK